MQNNIPPLAPDNDDDTGLPESAPTNPPFDQGTHGKAVAKATVGIGALHFVRFILGFVAQPLIAHNLGLQWQADAYAVSTDIIQRIWLLFEKVINPAFLPNFIKALKEEGEERAWRFASTTITLLALILLVTMPLAWWRMPELVHLLSRKSGPEQIALTISMARWLIVGLFCLGLSSLTYTILNGYKRFVYAALGDVLWKIGILTGAIAAVVTHASPTHAVRLVVGGFLVGTGLKLVPHLFAIGKKWRYFRPRLDLKDPLAKKMFALAVPLILGIVVSEMRGFYLLSLADSPQIHIDASRAALKWSGLIGNNLIQVFPYALSIGIFPYLADMALQRDKQPLTETLVGALRVCIFFFGPITAILIALRFPLLRAVWESGRFTQADTLAISAPFVAYTLGLIGFACEMQLNQTFYAMTRAWTPTLAGLATTVLWIVIARYGVIDAGWGLAAMAGAEAFSKSVKCLVMWLFLRPRLGEINWRQNLLFCVKVTVGALLAAAASSAVVTVIQPHMGAAHFKIHMLLAVTASGIVGVAVFLALAALLRVEEMSSLGKLTKRFSRR